MVTRAKEYLEKNGMPTEDLPMALAGLIAGNDDLKKLNVTIYEKIGLAVALALELKPFFTGEDDVFRFITYAAFDDQQASDMYEHVKSAK